MNPSRRRFVNGGLGLSTLWLAGCAEEPMICPDGTAPVEMILEETIVYTEGGGEVLLGPKGGLKGNIVVPKVVITRKLTCTPPAPRKTPSDPLLIDLRRFDLSTSSLLRLKFELPQLLSITDNTARLSVAAAMMNGGVSHAVFDLVRDADGFRLMNPGAADYWALTTGRHMTQASWSVDPMQTEALGSGSGLISAMYGIGGSYLGQQAEFAFGNRGRPIFQDIL